MGRTFLPALRSRAVETKAYPYATLSTGGYTPGGGGIWRSLSGSDRAANWDLEAVTAEAFERSVWAFRCIELFSSSQSRLPFRLARGFDTTDQKVLEEHPLYRVLNRRANPLETARAFRKRLSAQVLMSKKGAFVEVKKTAMGTISRLDLLDPSRVEIVPSDNGDYIDHFAYTRRDGHVVELDPSEVRWVREPHPIDPFCGTTPLEAAGMSIELDQQARVYNVSFIKNDTRPGGVLAVDTDTLNDQEMLRLETRFQPGAFHAGELAVVASGPGGLKYVDTTTRPRDMAYGDMANNAKREILTAFGIGESVLGSSEGRTFDNAEQEDYNFWTKPMPPHLDLIAGAFADDVDEDLTPFLDTSSVEALELPRRRRRVEAREEFEKGLRSIDEYRPLSDLDPVDNPQTRALWVSPQKAPVPMFPADAPALLGGEAAPGGGPVGPPAPQGRTAAQVVDEAVEDADTAAAPAEGPAARAVAEALTSTSDVPPPGAAAAAVNAARGGSTGVSTVRTASQAVRQAVEGKALTPGGEAATFEVDEATTTRVEAALAAALTVALTRQKGVITARLDSPKTRKGTRFWRAEVEGDTRTGDDLIDMDRVVDVERWAQEAMGDVAPILQGATAETAAAFLTAAASAGALSGVAAAADLTAQAVKVTAGAAGGALLSLGVAVADVLTDLTGRLHAAQGEARSVQDIKTVVDDHYDARTTTLAKDLAADLAFMVTNAAAERAATALTPESDEATIVREWVSRRDAKVRPTHRAVDGDVLPVGEPFMVGGHPMRYPQDPAAPLGERINCRCRCVYTIPAATVFTLPE